MSLFQMFSEFGDTELHILPGDPLVLGTLVMVQLHVLLLGVLEVFDEAGGLPPGPQNPEGTSARLCSNGIVFICMDSTGNGIVLKYLLFEHGTFML